MLRWKSLFTHSRSQSRLAKGVRRKQRADGRRLLLETLEDRRLLAITVDTLDDVVDAGDGVTSLREAIAAATVDEVIDFSVSGTITLDSALREMTIDTSLTIDGSNAITIDAGNGNDNVFNTGDGSRIFNVTDSSNNQIDVTLSGLTLTGGDTGGTLGQTNNGFPGGGAILNLENLTILSSSISGNAASPAMPANSGGSGGAIYNSASGTLTIMSSTLSGNASRSGVLDAGSETGGGGAIWNGGAAAISNSTLSGNQVPNQSGESGISGGAILNNTNASLSITNSTLTANIAFFGGAVANFGTTDLSNTIVADNSAPLGPNFVGEATGSFNLIGNPAGLTGISNGVDGNQFGTDGSPIDPMLEPLADNGGPTQTHALMAGSPARDMGDPAIASPPDFDQRGSGFDRITGGRIDIGAFELQVATSPFVVTTTTDVVDENDGVVSLREAITTANSITGAEEVTFDETVFATSQTISLTDQLPTITDALTITGPTSGGVTLDAMNRSRVFSIDDSDENNLIEVTLSKLTVTGGFGGEFDTGGGILNHEMLTVDSSTITGNFAGFGGGIGNEANAVLNVINSTISGNMADSGGGIENFGTATVVHSTVTNNTADFVGDGIDNGGTLTINNSIVAGNGDDDVSNQFGTTVGTHNVIGNGVGLTDISNGSDGNRVGTSGAPLDPMLGTLSDNDGPTQTHALLDGSPAINAGDPTAVAGQGDTPAFDQRGNGFSRVLNDQIDIGAFESDLLPVMATTSVTLDGGVLTITDTDEIGVDDELTLSLVGANLVITSNQSVGTQIAGSSGSGTMQVTVPFAGITQIDVNALAGNDRLTLDYSGGFITSNINFVGGEPTSGIGDSVVLVGGAAIDSTVYRFANASDGTIELDFGGGGIDSTINYTGLEPIIDNLNVLNRMFWFIGGAETITLSDDATANDNLSLIDSTLGESVNFVNPTNSLTINAGAGADAINVTGTDTMTIIPNLLINGGTGNDTISVVPSQTAISVDGDDPVAGDADVPPGDRLIIPLATGVTLDNNPAAPADVAMLTGAADITFASIEQLLIVSPDANENNDALANAVVLGSPEQVTLNQLSINSIFDVDFFKYTANETGKLNVRALFDHDIGNLDLEIQDMAGNVIAMAMNSATGTNQEELVIPVVDQEMYFVRVFGAGGAINNYDLVLENTPAPVPTGLRLDTGSDTGRSTADGITADTTPTIIVQADVLGFVDENNNNVIDGNELAALTAAQAATGTVPGIAVEVTLINSNNPAQAPIIGFADPFVAAFPTVYTFTPTTELADGVYFATARTVVIDGQTPNELGRSGVSAPLFFTLDTVAPPVSFGLVNVVDTPSATDGLAGESDTGVNLSPPTLNDRVTSDETPTFWGRAEANSLVTLYLDVDDNGTIEPATDFFLGQTVAVPLDGNNAFAEGSWEITANTNLNSDTIINALGAANDGTRQLLVTAQDAAGNPVPAAGSIGPAVDGAILDSLTILLDVFGPMVTSVSVNAQPATGGGAYDLFDPKPSVDGPTPLVESITINFIDLPARVDQDGTDNDFLYPTLDAISAISVGNYSVVGDQVGQVGIAAVVVDEAIKVSETITAVTDETNFTVAGFVGAFNIPVVGDFITFNNGGISGLLQRVTAFDAATGMITIDQSAGAAPAVGDGFSVITAASLFHAAQSDFNTPEQASVTTANDATSFFAANINAGSGVAVGDYLRFNTGAAAGTLVAPEIRRVTAFDAGTGLITVDSAFPAAPVAGDGFTLLSFSNLNAVVDGLLSTASVTLEFAEPLPDDRFTLTVNDSLTDPAGNQLDGESDAAQPLDDPVFNFLSLFFGTPFSGDFSPGGDFVARFTVDSRAEIGVWAAGSALVDTNGNFLFDPENLDASNRDLTYHLGFSSDNIFAGNFIQDPNGQADGFDKIAAYGRVGNQWRWMIDTSNDGIPDVIINEPLNINGLPVAGNFDGNAANGDEIGVFDGSRWFFDTNHDFQLDAASAVTANYNGFPIVGDFDGNGTDDLGTYSPINNLFGGNLFSIDTDNDGVANNTFRVGVGAGGFNGFTGVRERPVAADMNADGIDDIGLWVPDGSALVPGDQGEWYFLVSGDIPSTPAVETTVLDRITNGFVSFTPSAFSNDIYARFGNSFSVPLVGNFDPPVTATAGVSEVVSTEDAASAETEPPSASPANTVTSEAEPPASVVQEPQAIQQNESPDEPPVAAEPASSAGDEMIVKLEDLPVEEVEERLEIAPNAAEKPAVTLPESSQVDEQPVATEDPAEPVVVETAVETVVETAAPTYNAIEQRVAGLIRGRIFVKAPARPRRVEVASVPAAPTTISQPLPIETVSAKVTTPSAAETEPLETVTPKAVLPVESKSTPASNDVVSEVAVKKVVPNVTSAVSDSSSKENEVEETNETLIVEQATRTRVPASTNQSAIPTIDSRARGLRSSIFLRQFGFLTQPLAEHGAKDLAFHQEGMIEVSQQTTDSAVSQSSLLSIGASEPAMHDRVLTESAEELMLPRFTSDGE